MFETEHRSIKSWNFKEKKYPFNTSTKAWVAIIHRKMKAERKNFSMKLVGARSLEVVEMSGLACASCSHPRALIKNMNQMRVVSGLTYRYSVYISFHSLARKRLRHTIILSFLRSSSPPLMERALIDSIFGCLSQSIRNMSTLVCSRIAPIIASNLNASTIPNIASNIWYVFPQLSTDGRSK